MVKQTIQIYARLKPLGRRHPAGIYSVEEDETSAFTLDIIVPRDSADGFVNNKRESYKFKFQKIFDQEAKQDEVFEVIAKPVAECALAGYNGTIFAYGQTGSGKTFTITGGAERYSDRGIIPRTLSYIFQQLQKDSSKVYTTHISYLEIYNECGYDLLDPRHEASRLEDLPKVTIMEDPDQNIHLKHLSLQQATNEEEALNLLFLGDTNRMIAETPMNQASTRSHCIFTIHISSKEPGSATIRRSKLHLVDLAGSERVAKTGVGGQLLTEAKYINLSLHYLEQVIIALSEKNRSHIPYRNSMMTSVLRDSLGGNCMTTMIATLSVEKRNIDESISTCRFAQRVALIKNEAVLNEEIDPRLVIARMMKEIQELKDELALVTGEQRSEELKEEELHQLVEQIKVFVEDTDPESTLEVGADMRKIKLCFNHLKKLINETKLSSNHLSEPTTAVESTNSSVETEELKKLKDLLQQRDNEINILVNMLKKEKKKAQDAFSQLNASSKDVPASEKFLLKNVGNDQTPSITLEPKSVFPPEFIGDSSKQEDYDMTEGVTKSRLRLISGNINMGSFPSLDGVFSGGRNPSLKGRLLVQRNEIIGSNLQEHKTGGGGGGEMSIGRQEAFQIFKRDYSDSITIEDNKQLLKQRFAEAKTLGEKVNEIRNKINYLKGEITQRHMQKAAQAIVNPHEMEKADPVEEALRAQIEEQKISYKTMFNRLKGLKIEIEHLQFLLEKAKVKLQRDFETWWSEEAAHLQDQEEKPSLLNLASVRKSPLPREAHSLTNVNRVPNNSRTSFYEDVSLKSSISSHSSPKTRSSPVQGASISFTGDHETDADILAFIRARQNLLHRKGSGIK